QLRLRPLYFVFHLGEVGRPFLARADVLVNPLEIGFIFRERGNEILARHIRFAHTQRQHAAFLFTHIFHRAAQGVYQPVGQARRELEQQELLIQLLVQFLDGFAMRAIARQRALPFFTRFLDVGEAARGFGRIWSDGSGVSGAALVVLVIGVAFIFRRYRLGLGS